jgi:parallel beta-helix repeat protein
VGLYSNHTTIYGNTITDNELGIHIADSSDNRILHNNLIDNIYHQLLSESSNILDDGKEGNYWSNYNGTDNDGDGIGDIPYVIDENNQDNYPLIAPIHPFDAGTWEQTQYFVDCISNSTVSDFCFDPTEGAFLRFNVEGESGTSGFCRVTIPKELLQSEGDWIVLVGGASVTPTVNEDTSSTYLYFTYQHSTKTIEIRGTSVIPEFQSWALILFTLTAFAAAAVIYMLKPPKN